MEIAIINESLFKQNSPIKEDTIISKFVPYILIAQKMYVERIIGRPLLEELQDQIKEAQGSTVDPDDPAYPITPDNQALILEIAPTLSFYSVYQGLPFHWAEIVNKGITVRESENSKAVELKDLAQLRRWLKDDAEYLSTRLVAYMCGCKEKYPDWKPGAGYDCGCGCGGDTGSKAVPLDAGIYIPKRRRKSCD